MKNPVQQDEAVGSTGNGALNLSGGQEEVPSPGAGEMIGQLAQPKTTKSPQAVSAAQAAANYLSANIGANLKTSNDPQIIKGGVASEASTVASSALKKRSKAGLSNQLGINV